MPYDQRCSDRTTVTLPAELITSEETRTVKIVDISSCGIGVICSQPINISDDVSLKFALPGYAQNNTLSVQVKVIHTTNIRNQQLIGLSLSNPSQHDILVFKEFFNFHQRFEA